MNSSELKDRIGQKRPRYKEQYYTLMDSISQKGDSSGKGDFSTFAAFYQTYMYAFIVGYKLGVPKFLEKGDTPRDFAPLNTWQPNSVRDFVLMLLLNETEDYGFSWLELENANQETIENFITELIRQMEGYANAGLEYLQSKWNEGTEFESPFVFVNFLEELNRLNYQNSTVF